MDLHYYYFFVFQLELMGLLKQIRNHTSFSKNEGKNHSYTLTSTTQCEHTHTHRHVCTAKELYTLWFIQKNNRTMPMVLQESRLYYIYSNPPKRLTHVSEFFDSACLFLFDCIFLCHYCFLVCLFFLLFLLLRSFQFHFKAFE